MRLFSSGGRCPGMNSTDHLWLTMEYAGGPRVNLGFAVFTPAENRVPIDVVGDKGRISADLISGRVDLILRDGTVRSESPDRPAGYRFDGFPGSLESLAEFIKSIRTGRSPLADLRAATRATALALAAAESEASGQPIWATD